MINRNHRPGRKTKSTTKVFLATALIVGAVSFLISAMGTSPYARNEQELKATVSLIDSLEKLIEIEKGKVAEVKRIRFSHVGTIGPGQGMFQALENLGLPNRMCLKLVNTLSDSVELLSLTAGEHVSVELDPEDTTNILSFSYSPNPAVVHKLVHQDGAFNYHRLDRPTTIRYRLVESTLEQGSTLDQTLRAKGIHGAMVGVVNGVLLCKISFNTQARAGDRFKVLLRERYYQDSILIEGQVLYTCYDGLKTGFHEAFRYDDGDPKSSYTAHYTEKGEALIHSGLRYPLDRLHISSVYGMRNHPVSGRRTMHRGVDYRAPTGAPVYAVAKGVVVRSGYGSANGNYIAIRHSDNFTSYYLHLHRRLVRKGQMVNTRQLIGKVGSTGISTGPHLHFGFKKPNGTWMNPLQKRMIATPRLEGERLARLTAQVSDIRAALDSLTNDMPPIAMAVNGE